MTLTLIGQYDSPFVRRVGIALTLYGMPFRQEPWSVFGDAAQIRAYSPLTRVPVLLLPSGEALIDSHMILDYLDTQVSNDRALFPQHQPLRYQTHKIAALATGLGDKAVSLFYELRLHDQPSEVFVTRCRAQITDTLVQLEAELSGHPSTFWHGAGPGHADIAMACVWRFICEAHPGLIRHTNLPRLAAQSEMLEATAAFKSVSQPFITPT